MAGGFAHVAVVADLCARLDSLKLADEHQFAIGMNRDFCTIGAVAPDYPYLTIALRGDAAAWADKMHYRQTGEMIRAGVRWLRARDDSNPAANQAAIAWLFGYAAHVGTDLTIHPVVENRVGPYAENKQGHRICEMNQDAWIWQRMDLGRQDQSEYFDPVMRSTTAPDGGMAAPIPDMWRAMLAACHPADFAATPPDIDAWHRGYRRIIDAVEEGPGLFAFTRHLLADRGASYPRPDEIDMTYIEDLDTPFGKKHYDEVFDHATAAVASMWEAMSEALEATDAAAAEEVLAGIPDADLDSGLLFSNNTHAAWRIA